MNHTQILTESVLTLRDRDVQYGSMEETMIRACEIFEMITGREFSPYEANIFMHSLKLSRIRKSPTKADNYIDGVNYLAFAGEFATKVDAAATNVSDEILNSGMRDLVNQLNTQEG
jgi:SRSO17 transposase